MFGCDSRLDNKKPARKLRAGFGPERLAVFGISDLHSHFPAVPEFKFQFRVRKPGKAATVILNRCIFPKKSGRHILTRLEVAPAGERTGSCVGTVNFGELLVPAFATGGSVFTREFDDTLFHEFCCFCLLGVLRSRTIASGIFGSCESVRWVFEN